ncbi:hypothetical protein CJP72_17570 [Citrobacter sp. NCU1]|uniref:DUF5908 family protein n=1 Tax=Citrobacter sp. NCU1 TaxID=2026683 RepID=UPI00139182A9|nr:DUF5908 family protein [Citrobacter sp. NCU1]NDO82521.1 hypothetical protein [Citrobacter sp. NCU1]
MTVEIRELIIQAKITDVGPSQPAVTRIQLPEVTQHQDEQLVDMIIRRVLEQLQEQGWGKP